MILKSTPNHSDWRYIFVPFPLQEWLFDWRRDSTEKRGSRTGRKRIGLSLCVGSLWGPKQPVIRTCRRLFCGKPWRRQRTRCRLCRRLLALRWNQKLIGPYPCWSAEPSARVKLLCLPGESCRSRPLKGERLSFRMEKTNFTRKFGDQVFVSQNVCHHWHPTDFHAQDLYNLFYLLFRLIIKKRHIPFLKPVYLKHLDSWKIMLTAHSYVLSFSLSLSGSSWPSAFRWKLILFFVNLASC